MVWSEWERETAGWAEQRIFKFKHSDGCCRTPSSWGLLAACPCASKFVIVDAASFFSLFVCTLYNTQHRLGFKGSQSLLPLSNPHRRSSPHHTCIHCLSLPAHHPNRIPTPQTQISCAAARRAVRTRPSWRRWRAAWPRLWPRGGWKAPPAGPLVVVKCLWSCMV